MHLNFVYLFGVFALIIWAATWQNQQSECAPSKDLDQPGHPSSLSAWRKLGSLATHWAHSALSAQQRLWSDWADAQADLSLHWAHTHFVGFVMSRLILILHRRILWITISRTRKGLQITTQNSWIGKVKWAASCQNQQNVRPAKTQISLGICPVWSVFNVGMKKPLVLGFLLSTQRRLWSGWLMPQLVWVFVGRTGHFVGFFMRWPKW